MKKHRTRDGEAGMNTRPNRQWKSLTGMLALAGALEMALAGPAISAGPPAASLVSNAVVTPTAAWTAYGSGTTHTPGLAAWVGLPPEMMALARALGSDRVLTTQLDAGTYTKNVFEYVRNNIDTEFRFGLSKGGRGALIDQSGTAFDQAELMVKLLRAANVSASYQIGTITLTAQQFGQWTGLFSTLNQGTQTVAVNAKAACQLLADGGIPSTCNSAATGSLSSITLGHIWVSANGNLYDPSFKPYTLSNGIDTPTAMGCGTNSASTCGSAMTTAANATSGTVSVGTQAGIPYVQYLDEAQLDNRLTTAATAIQNQIQSTNRLARLEDIVGGRVLTLSATPSIGPTLSYVTATQATWSGDIPDQFRTKLRVRSGPFGVYQSMVLVDYASADRTFFVDELAGRSLQLHSIPEQAMLLDSTPLAANACSTCNGNVLLDVDHPYATAGYADESISLAMYADSGDGVHSPTGGTFPATIIQGWGNTGQSAERHFAGLQEILPTATTSYGLTYDGGALPTVTRTDFATRNQAMLGVRLLVQSAVADRLITGLSKSVITRHHSLGIAFAHAYSPAMLANISVQSAVSVISATNDSVARSAAFETSASTFATIEGSVNQQLESTPVGLSTSSYFQTANANLPGNPRRKFLQMSSAQILAAYSSNSTGYFTALKNAATAGYGAIFPEAGGTEILTKTNAIAHTIGTTLKGGAALSTDPVSHAMETLRLADIASERKKYLAVSRADGSATLSQTDLVTGAGEFPYALPLRRTYTSAVSVVDNSDTTFTNTWNPSTESQSVSNNISQQYSGPDSAANSRIGYGWNHNYNVTATYTGNGPKALGQDYAIEASASIAALRGIYDLARSPSLVGRVTSMLASDWLARYQWSYNSVAVDKGGSTETFQRLPVGFFTPTGAAYLEQSGAPAGNDLASVSFKYTGNAGDTINFGVGRANVVMCCGATFMGRSLPYFYATDWKFPDGVTVSFHYTNEYVVESYDPTIYPPCHASDSGSNCPTGRITLPMGWVLQSVSNNLGRSLTFLLTSSTVPVLVGSDGGPGVPQTLTSRFTITGATDENGRSVTYSPSGARLVVRGPDQRDNTYDYAPGSDSPDPTVMGRSAAVRLRRWFTPSDAANTSDPSKAFRVLGYDELFRVRTVRDPIGNRTFYYSSGVMGSERWKRSETVTPLGFVTANTFDDHNNLIKAVDANGLITTTTYDRADRKLVTTMPEGNTVEQTYDVRSNVLSTLQRSKPGSGYSNPTTSTIFVEDANTVNCSNWKTCNKPSSTTDANSNVTNYTYSPSTGQALTVLAPAVPLSGSNVQPLTTLCYTPYNGISMLSGLIDQVNTTTNRVRSFTYNSSNKYVPQSTVVDPSASLTPPSSSSLSCPATAKASALNLATTLNFDGVGNVASVDGPRTDVSDVTNYTFDLARRITKIAAPLGSTTRYCYDADGLVRSTQRARAAGLADPNASTAASDGSCSAAYPASNWQSEVRDYWATGDLLSVQDAEGNVTRYAYDDDGRQQVVQDPDGRQTATVYDPANQVLATWRGGRTWIDGNGRPSGAPSSGTPWDPTTYASGGNSVPLRYADYGYTSNGKQNSVVDANNNETNYVYDGRDRLAFTLFPDPSDGSRCIVAAPVKSSTTPSCTGGQTYEKSTYDLNGNRRTLRTRRANTLTWTYDAANRVNTKAVTGSPALGLVTQTYNLLNEPLSLSSPVSGSIPAHDVSYDYDAAGRKLYEDNSFNGKTYRVSYDYADNVNRTRTTWPDGYFVYYSYDALNRMEYARENSTNANELAHYQYDSLSRRSELRFANLAANRTTYSYEPDSQIDLLTQFLGSTTVTLDYDHNASGQIKRVTASDNFYLPGPVTGEPIPIPTAYAPDKLNRYGSLTISAAATTPTHDANGNLLTWGPTASKQTYTYDSENRLRTASVTGGTNNTYDYDALGRRLTRTVGSTSTYYLLDGDDEIAEYDSTGTVLRRYLIGSTLDDRIARAEGSAISNPTKTYYHVNHQGSVIDTTNPDGSIAQQLAYDEYGNLTSQQPPASKTGEPFRFTGRRFDPETGLYYYRARYYAPQLGRFLQVDPVGYKDQLHLYAYVGNDPLNNSDPSGTDELSGMLPDPGYMEYRATIMQEGGKDPDTVPGAPDKRFVYASLAPIGVVVVIAQPETILGAGGLLDVGEGVAAGETSLAEAGGSQATAAYATRAVATLKNGWNAATEALSNLTTKAAIALHLKLGSDLLVGEAVTEGVEGSETVEEMSHAGEAVEEIQKEAEAVMHDAEAVWDKLF
jgi:RHS repeat-associated protein